MTLDNTSRQRAQGHRTQGLDPLALRRPPLRFLGRFISFPSRAGALTVRFFCYAALVRNSQQKYASYSAAKKKQITAEAEAIYTGLPAIMAEGPDSIAVEELIARWRCHIEYVWSPNDGQLLGLADLYNHDPAFRNYYDVIDPRLAPFLRGVIALCVPQVDQSRISNFKSPRSGAW